jgi:hypothetical protein
MRRWRQIALLIAGVLLIAFGLAVLLGASVAHQEVRHFLAGEDMTLGTADDPAVAANAPQWAGQPPGTGAEASDADRTGAVTHLDMAHLAEKLALLSAVVGVSLILVGIVFLGSSGRAGRSSEAIVDQP